MKPAGGRLDQNVGAKRSRIRRHRDARADATRLGRHPFCFGCGLARHDQTILQKVRAGTLDMGLGSFKNTPGVRRTLFFRFSLMVIRPDSPTALRRTSTTWSALKGERLILPSPAPMRAMIDQHLAQVGVASRPAMVLNRFDTLIAMVEAGEGTGIVP
jgi:DNA-binding transcriptional LysR family regulator